MCVSLCGHLLFAVHAILSEAFSEWVGVDLQLRDLTTTTKKMHFSLGLCSPSFWPWLFFLFILHFTESVIARRNMVRALTIFQTAA